MPIAKKINSLYSKSDVTRAKAIVALGTKEPYRTEFRRDFARLVHSPAFRRLQGKLQLFPGHESDFFRNRLTHSLEVAQIAKSIAIKINSTNDYFRKFPLDLDLVEFAGLAHDLGHPPFGHTGEYALDECMRDSGGFEGNAQTLRILARLEKKEVGGYLAAPGGVERGRGDRRFGLNLTYRALASVLKYDSEIPFIRDKKSKISKGYYQSEARLVSDVKSAVLRRLDSGLKSFRTIECEIMDIADDIAYSTYDLEDTFKAGFVTPLDFVSGWDWNSIRRVAEKCSTTIGKKIRPEKVLEILTRLFADLLSDTRKIDAYATKNSGAVSIYIAAMGHEISRQVADVGYLRSALTSKLVRESLRGVDVILNQQFPQLSTIKVAPPILLKIAILKHFTFEATILAPRLRVATRRGGDIVKQIFSALIADGGHELLPVDFRANYVRLEKIEDKRRVVCDFIAGMTDRYAIEFYGRLMSERPESIFKPH